MSRQLCKLVVAIGLYTMASSMGGPASAANLSFGDVMAAESRDIHWFDPTGSLIMDLSGARYPAGLAFDVAGNLYAADFQNGVVYRWDSTGQFLGVFGSQPPAFRPESITFDNSGNVYVGSVAPTSNITEYDPTGQLLQVYSAADRVDHLDLDCDQCTMFYTTEGRTIRRYDICSQQQLSDWPASGAFPHAGHAYGMRIVPGTQSVLVADEIDIHLVDPNGIVRTYDAPGEDYWFSLGLDSDPRYFWAGTFEFTGGNLGNVYKFEINGTGNPVLPVMGPIATTGQASGIAVCGAPTAARNGATTPDMYVSLHPSGFDASYAIEAGGCSQVGYAGSVLNPHAWIWGGSGPGQDLHPATGFVSSWAWSLGPDPAQGGFQKVGGGETNAGPTHALLWDANDVPFDIHPTLLTYLTISDGLGTDGTQHVGFGAADQSSPGHALLWTGTGSGTYATAIDLNGGSSESVAQAVSAGRQVGYFGSTAHAAMWTGTAASLIDLNPPGFAFSTAWDTSFGRTAGRGSATPGGVQHALLWTHPAAGSYIDLHNYLPAGYPESGAYGIDGNQIVGYADTATYPHAMLWEWDGTTFVTTDLHGLLPADYDWSEADGVDNGQIVGFARNSTTGNFEAILWTNGGHCPCAPDHPTPVLLVTLETSVIDGQVHLEWRASSDADAAIYDVYRSADGVDWQRINADPIGSSGPVYQYVDKDVTPGMRYQYEVEFIGPNGVRLRVARQEVNVPSAQRATLKVEPSITRGTANLSFSIPRPGDISVDAYDLSGRRVAQVVDGHYGSGTTKLEWTEEGQDGRALPGGIYYLRLRTGSDEARVRLVLVR